MEKITANPFRILGLLSNSTEKEIQKQLATLKRFAEVGKNKSFDSDFEAFGSVERTPEHVERASSKIERQDQRVLFALFWFTNSGAIDDIAIKALSEGQVSKASDVWNKTLKGSVTSNNWSSYSNFATLSMWSAIKKAPFDHAMFGKGVELKITLIRSSFFDDFLRTINVDPSVVSKEDICKQFLDAVIEGVSAYIGSGVAQARFLKAIFGNLPESDSQYVIDKFSSKVLSKIDALVESTLSKIDSDPEVAAKEGKKLYANTKDQIEYLKIIFSKGHIKYDLARNKTAEALLQCSIAYFNHFIDTDRDPGQDSLYLIDKARLSLKPTGKVAQRIDDNYDTIKAWVDDTPERLRLKKLDPHLNSLYEVLDDLESLDQSSSVAQNVSIAKSKLAIIAQEIGYGEELYTNLCDALAVRAVNTLVDIANNLQDRVVSKSMTLDQLLSQLEVQDRVFGSLLTLDLGDRAQQYTSNSKRGLQQLIGQIKQAKSSNSGGCYIATMAYGDYDHPQVMKLRRFRDDVLSESAFGRMFIKVYYALSPRFVRILRNSKGVNTLIRKLLDKWIKERGL